MELPLPYLPAAEVRVDGTANEAVWASALELPNAPPFEPSAEAPAIGSMRTRVLASEAALYAHFVVTDPEPAEVRAGLGRRDSREMDDRVGLAVDVRGEGRSAYVFSTNPLGVQTDAVHLVQSFGDDESWDAVWRSAARRTDTGWEAEIAIPWAALGLGGEVESVRLSVIREVARAGQTLAWPATPTGSDPLQTAATLRGPGTLPKRAGVWVMPELTVSVPEGDSARLGIGGVAPGVTAGWEPGGIASAHATFNPDFSQLESDATQLDINARYALEYDEKRPFFLQALDQFDHPFRGVLYTRTVNAPLYGARASVNGDRLGVVALHGMDMAPPSSINEGGGWTPEALGSKPALVSVVRGRYALGEADSYVGALLSDRSVLESDLSNRMGGLDGRWRLSRATYVQAAALGSSTVLAPGEQATVAPAGRFDVYTQDARWWFHLRAEALAPGFRNENGYQPYDDRMGALAEGNYSFDAPAPAISRISVEALDARVYATTRGELREAVLDPSVWAQLSNGGFLKLDFSLGGEEFAGEWVEYRQLELYLEGAASDALYGELGGTLGSAPYYDPENPRAGRLAEGWAEVTFQPAPQVALTLSPVVSRMEDVDGTQLFLAYALRAKGELFFTREGWVRLVGELSQQDVQRWRVEPVAGWEWSPGRAVYAGGSLGGEEGGGDPDWQLFAKASWVFAL